MLDDEDDILTACALRFDGNKYVESTGFDHKAALDRFFVTGQFPQRREEQWTLFFMLQRYLMKWGGEYESKRGRHWWAFREFYLKVHEHPVPSQYRNADYDTTWRRRYHLHSAECTGLIQRIHNTTAYDDSAPPELGSEDISVALRQRRKRRVRR